MPVRPIAEHTEVPYDLMVLATLDGSGQGWAQLIKDGVDPEKLFPLRQMPAISPRAAAPPRTGAGRR